MTVKKHDVLRAVQLIVYIALAVACIVLLILDNDLYHAVARDYQVRTVCILLWITFAVSFVFLLLDFNFSSTLKKDFRELDYAVHTDTLSGLANRFSADSILEAYLDKPVPPDFCAAMIELTNIREVNELHGHLAGNKLIREFADILNESAPKNCCVARNGGNKFLAIFESASDEDIHAFSENIQRYVTQHNSDPDATVIRYRTGLAYHEPPEAAIRNVTDLVSLANRRIYDDIT